MFHFFEAITNKKGDALPGYFVTVTDSIGDSVDIYADNSATPISSVSGIANAAKVDDNGNASFYVAPGTYNLNIFAEDASTLYLSVSDIPMENGPQGIQGIQGPAGDVAKAASRTALAAITGQAAGFTRYLAESGREGAFVFSTDDLSTEVAADTLQGIYVPPSSDTTGASGAWVRKFDGTINAAWHGLSASATAAANHTAITAALSLAETIGAKTVRIPDASHTLSASFEMPDGITLEGSGINSVLVAANAAGDDPWVINQTGGSDFTIRNLKLTPASTSSGTDNHRAGIHLVTPTGVTIENIWVQGHTNAHGVFMHDPTDCTIDKVHFDGGATDKNGTGVYLISPVNCKILNSTATNCFAGFAISGAGTDPTFTSRTIAQSYGNTIDNCFTSNCTTQAFDVNSSTYNTVSNCHAVNYAGASTHKAFQVKDAVGFENSSVGNKFIGCSAVNYPAGFGGVRTARAQFIGCTASNCTTNFIELSACGYFQFIGCSVSEFSQAGIWFGGANACHTFDGIKLLTSTATATGILTDAAGSAVSCNFENVTTLSTLAAYCNLGATSTNNRFGPGCRANDNIIIDASNSTVWPLRASSNIFSLTSGGTTPGTDYLPRGMIVAAARFIVTTTITGTPAVNAGRVGSTAAIVNAQAVTGSAGAVVTLTQASQLLAVNSNVAGQVSATGTAGAGFIQFEGLPRL
jgi:hypothetical protein